MLLCVREVIINYRNTELPHLVNNPVNCMAVIALPDMYLGMSRKTTVFCDRFFAPVSQFHKGIGTLCLDNL